MGFSYHAYLVAENVSLVRTRVAEMREPPLGLDVVPDKNLEVLFDEILHLGNGLETVAALYGTIVPELLLAIGNHLEETNPLVDAPTVRLLKFLRGDLEEMRAWGEATRAALSKRENRDAAMVEAEISEYIAASGGIQGKSELPGNRPGRRRSARPYAYDPVPQRDERFQDVFNMGVNAEVMLHDPEADPRAKSLMLLYKRLREIDVPEVMAAIMFQTPGKPWDYYRDMTRQLWDEARHAMMGQVGFRQLGLDWTSISIRKNWSYELNTLLKPIEAHGVLYFIEKGLMPKVGKRHEWEVARGAGNDLLSLFQDFDWADEVLHARIGRDWYVPEFPTGKEASEYGDRCWSSVYEKRENYVAGGKTRHENWWPAFYQRACEQLGWEVDPRLLEYAETDLETRADLEKMGVSG